MLENDHFTAVDASEPACIRYIPHMNVYIRTCAFDTLESSCCKQILAGQQRAQLSQFNATPHKAPRSFSVIYTNKQETQPQLPHILIKNP